MWLALSGELETIVDGCRDIKPHDFDITTLTTHALVDMMHHRHNAVDGGQSARIVFVDFAKAFDRVNHNVLMSKLVAVNLPDVIIRWMYSYLLYRRQRVKIGDVLSEWLPQIAGMPQGSYLGPLTLFCHTDSVTTAVLSDSQVH